ncbi:hypothetical protein HY772_08125 [Candidatus Woesearchaeota archaeon]|nr:hypothetical protein [Candidatus Woesearchaeota archaeon]
MKAMKCKARKRVARESTFLYVTEPRGDVRTLPVRAFTPPGRGFDEKGGATIEKI